MRIAPTGPDTGATTSLVEDTSSKSYASRFTVAAGATHRNFRASWHRLNRYFVCYRHASLLPVPRIGPARPVHLGPGCLRYRDTELRRRSRKFPEHRLSRGLRMGVGRLLCLSADHGAVAAGRGLGPHDVGHARCREGRKIHEQCIIRCHA